MPERTRFAVSAAEWRSLAVAAEKARAHAHAPYSNYRVGAALLTSRGVVRGCNVENASFPLCICAEAATVARAISQGWRSWRALAVATQGPEAGAPCGACRQILAEFDVKLPIALVVGGEIKATHTVGSLLPLCFTGDVLARSVRG